VRLVGVVRLHYLASGEILALGLGFRISRESPILQQGLLQLGIHLALLRTVSLVSVLCLALPNLEAFSLARDAGCVTALKGVASPKETLGRGLRWLRPVGGGGGGAWEAGRAPKRPFSGPWPSLP
jgi:hypothetical protein